MKDGSLQVQGFAESEFHDITKVQITECVPTLEHSLPITLILQEHLNFADIDYSLLDHDCCDHLIGSYHVQLLVPHNETKAHRIYGSLHTTRTHVGWIISGYECVIGDTYHMSTSVECDEDSQWDFEELSDDDDIAFSSKDQPHHKMG